jgi:hypothetical protein
VRLLRPAAGHLSLHGKEGIDGSSPSEGSAKVPQSGASSVGPTCTIHSVRWVWSPGAFRSRSVSVNGQKRPHCPPGRIGVRGKVRRRKLPPGGIRESASSRLFRIIELSDVQRREYDAASISGLALRHLLVRIDPHLEVAPEAVDAEEPKVSRPRVAEPHGSLGDPIADAQSYPRHLAGGVDAADGDLLRRRSSGSGGRALSRPPRRPAL